MSTIPYRFYAISMLLLIPILLLMQKDLGPINSYPLPASASTDQPSGVAELEGGAAESLSADDGDAIDGPLAPKPGVPHRAINALLPLYARCDAQLRDSSPLPSAPPLSPRLALISL